MDLVTFVRMASRALRSILVMGCLALMGLFAQSPSDAGAARPASRVTGLRLGGGASQRAVACGASRSLSVVTRGTRVVARGTFRRRGSVRSAGAALRVERCVGRRWRGVRAVGLGKRSRALSVGLAGLAAGDYRVSVVVAERAPRRRISSLAYLRVTSSPVATTGTTTSVPVRFHVINRNTSKARCAADDKPYDVVGRLVGPTDLLGRAAIPSLAIYVHNIGWGSYAWNLQGHPGYDHVTEMARLGHVSLVYDLLGYGASDHPPAGSVCYGSEADVLAQIAGQLRTGSYQATGPAPAPSVAKIAVVSQSIEGLTSQPAAYSFGGIDALVLTGWADQGQSQPLVTASAQTAAACGSPGANTTTDFTPEQFRSFYFADAEPAVVEAAVAQRSRIPCGETQSAVSTIAQDIAADANVKTPVLLMYGTKDALFTDPRDSANKQKAQFSGSPDVTLSFIEGAGNALQLERSAPRFRATLGAWLGQRGF